MQMRTSALKRGGSARCGQKRIRGEGLKNHQIFADVFYGGPHTSYLPGSQTNSHRVIGPVVGSISLAILDSWDALLYYMKFRFLDILF